MNRRRVIVGGSLMIAIAVTGGAVAWGVLPAGPKGPAAEASGRPAHVQRRADVGVAGPLGPEAFSLRPSYFKQVTFASNQLSQYQDIAVHLPAGKYLVQIQTRSASPGIGPDCMGVSFPLTQSAANGKAFRGYVSVANDGDPTTVSCYEQAATARSTATYDLFYRPITPKSGAVTP